MYVTKASAIPFPFFISQVVLQRVGNAASFRRCCGDKKENVPEGVI